MIAYSRDEIISATDMARNFSSALNSILEHGKEKLAISKNNKLQAVLIDIEEYERLKEAYDTLKYIEQVK
ncbi:MAG: Antitoxin [uncultured Sulfurovum sp.]|uniref:Antitoxin n=1 Tax=uncultured Sulfurovum sp. TaxID=269237 RepID=A0A6S6U183_9BACT|nr:MAG: Antitoxin [uncultured Sulfurovum sp.]